MGFDFSTCRQMNGVTIPDWSVVGFICLSNNNDVRLSCATSLKNEKVGDPIYNSSPHKSQEGEKLKPSSLNRTARPC